MADRQMGYEQFTSGSTLTNAAQTAPDTTFSAAPTIAAGHSMVASTAAAVHGTNGMRIVGNGSGVSFWEYNGMSATTCAFRFYYTPRTVVGTSLQIAQFRTASANVFRVGTTAGGSFVLQTGSGGTNSATWGTAPTAGTTYRFEGEMLSATSMTFRLYVGDSTTATFDAGTLTSLSLATVAVARNGLLSGASTNAQDFDDFAFNINSTAPIGPAVDGTVNAVVATVAVAAPAPTINAAASISAVFATVAVDSPIPVVSAETNISGSGTATVSVAAPSPSVSATQNPTVSAVAGTVAAASPAPTVAVSSSLTAVKGTVAASAPAPTLVVGSTVGAVVAVVNVNAPAPVVSTAGNGNVTAVVATVAVSAPAPAVSGIRNPTTTAVVALVTLAAPAPVISAAGNATVSAIVATATVQTVAPAVSASMVIAAPRALVSATAPAPSVVAGATVAALVSTISLLAQSPSVLGTGTGTVGPVFGSLNVHPRHGTLATHPRTGSLNAHRRSGSLE